MEDPCGLKVALLAAVEIQHADAPLPAFRCGIAAVLGDLQRRTQHVTDPKRQGASVPRCVCIIQEVADDPVDARGEDFGGNLFARLRRTEGDPAARPGETLDQLATGFGEQNESAFRARELKRTVKHDREHLVEHLPGSERTQTGEERIHLPEVEMPRGQRARLARLDPELRVADPDAVARLECGFIDLGVVDERATARPQVAHPPGSSVLDQLGMPPGNVLVIELQLRVRAATDRERTGRHRDRSTPGRVNDYQVQHSYAP